MKTQDAINVIRKGDPLKHDTIQEIGDMLEDLLMTNKERGEKIGRLRTRIEAEEARNFKLEQALKEVITTLHIDNAELNPIGAIEHADSVARNALNGG